MASQLTVTAKRMTGLTVTAQLVQNVVSMNFNHERQVLTVTKADGTILEYDISGATTVTDTVSGTSNTWVVS